MSATTRRGRGKSQKTLDLIYAARAILEEIQPATVRAVCYRLFVAGLIDDMSVRSTSKVSRALVHARETGFIPWPWVVDEHRQAERPATWNNPGELIEAAVAQYRRDYWVDQPQRVEVWSEKGTVRGTLAPVLRAFGVALRVMHGFGSATAIHDAAQETLRSDKPLTILYVGDWDPSGLYMSEADIPARLARYNGRANIQRIALTEHDVPGLPGFEAATKSGDTRHRWFVERYGRRCWELDAMPPPTLRERVEDEIVERLDPELWDRARLVEDAEVASMEGFLGDWQKLISGQVAKYGGEG